MRDAGPTVVPATEPIVGLNSRGGWNEYGANAGTRRHRDALVGKAQTATGTALGMGQTLQGGSNIMKRRGKISLLNAKPNTKGEVRKLLLDYRETKKKRTPFNYIFSVRRALSIALSLAVIDQRSCHHEQQDQLLHFRNKSKPL